MENQSTIRQNDCCPDHHDVVHIVYRTEYQVRGSPHVHIMVFKNRLEPFNNEQRVDEQLE